MPETWLSREVPILEAVAAAEEEGVDAHSDWLVERTGLSPREVGVGLKALVRAGYVTGEVASSLGDSVDDFMEVELLERGRRTVGKWPTEEGGLDVLLELLAERIDAEPDAATKSRLTRLREAAQGVGKDLGTSLLTAWLKSVSGLP